jgi:SPP1 gp7 family putative phage head morphogenesis protein
MLSAYEPPSNPADLEAWLLEREEEIAKATVRALTRIIDRSLDAFVSSLTASGDMSAFDGIPGEWSAFVREDLADRLGGMYLSGGVSAWVQSPGTDALPDSTLNAWTDVVNDQAVQYATTATNRLTGPVADSIWNDLRQKVSNAVATGMSTEKLTEQVLLMGEFATYRAEMIARTEANGAYNNGNYQANQALGDVGPVEKYWIATGDDRTRPTHREADGQVRAFNAPFNVGSAEMLYPHDPAGPASEVVNCRCVVGYLYPGMDRPDGTTVPDEQVTTSASPQSPR